MQKKKHKYGAKKAEVNGITFDSKAEARYYMYLLSLQAKGEVTEIELQPVLPLLPKFIYKGANRQKMDYVLDFKVTYISGLVEYIDVKGVATKDALMKRKLAEFKYPDLNIKWVGRALAYSESGWLEYDELQKIKRRRKREAKGE